DILIFIDKKKLIPQPDFAEILAQQTAIAPKDKEKALAAAVQIYGEKMVEYSERQNYLLNTNISVLAMPGFMEAGENKQWYPAKFEGKDWQGNLYDPRRQKFEADGSPCVNKLTKEFEYEQYGVDASKYPEAMRGVMARYGTLRPRDQGELLFNEGHFYAPDVFDRICQGMSESGEPGIQFWNAMNVANANNHVYDLNTTNSCFAAGT